MKSRFINFIAFSCLCLIVSLTLMNSAMAATTTQFESADTVKQAAKEVVKDTGAKEIFGKSENGDQLIDDAKARASQKLDNLAEKADSQTELPRSEEVFLDNLQN